MGEWTTEIFKKCTSSIEVNPHKSSNHIVNQATIPKTFLSNFCFVESELQLQRTSIIRCSMIDRINFVSFFFTVHWFLQLPLQKPLLIFVQAMNELVFISDQMFQRIDCQTFLFISFQFSFFFIRFLFIYLINLSTIVPLNFLLFIVLALIFFSLNRLKPKRKVSMRVCSCLDLDQWHLWTIVRRPDRALALDGKAKPSASAFDLDWLRHDTCQWHHSSHNFTRLHLLNKHETWLKTETRLIHRYSLRCQGNSIRWDLWHLFASQSDIGQSFSFPHGRTTLRLWKQVQHQYGTAISWKTTGIYPVLLLHQNQTIKLNENTVSF